MKIDNPSNHLTCTLIGVIALTTSFVGTAEPAPKLILQITVDQLRGDLPGR